MDYLEFYKLQEYPFSNAVDSRFYFNSEQHSEAIIRVKYAIDTRKGLAVVVGDIGTGKTTLARRLLDELDEEKYEAALLVVLHSSVTSDWLMKKIAVQIDVENPGDSKIELLGQIYERLLDIHESGLKTAVLIDEVQMLQSREIMEEFRGILNMETDGGKLITFVFFGLPEMESLIALDAPLKQRVAVMCRMTAFEEQVTDEYIRHRLKIAGCDKDLFTPDAIKDIHFYSKGIPRLINTICDNSLLEGSLVKKQEIDKDIIESIAVTLGLKEVKEADEKKAAKRRSGM
ncbi:cell division control protein 6 [bacterium BMS3Abin10]|nr:cell division control protein 6 [bacterium BMS3Abin10]GBE38453.1 cell division control protein 6 [bacterium BMS3Bbin08]HDH34594.1 AAA family ATPase [Nitrospirota bacterium]